MKGIVFGPRENVNISRQDARVFESDPLLTHISVHIHVWWIWFWIFMIFCCLIDEHVCLVVGRPAYFLIESQKRLKHRLFFPFFSFSFSFKMQNLDHYQSPREKVQKYKTHVQSMWCIMHHTLIRSNELQLRSHKKGERPKTKVSAPPTSSFQGKPTLHSSFLPYIFLFPIPSKKKQEKWRWRRKRWWWMWRRGPRRRSCAR